jgi:flagellar assembly protein FliH
MLTHNSLQKDVDPAAVGVTKIRRDAAPQSYSTFNQLELTLGSFTVAGRPGGENLSPEMKLITELRQQGAQLRSRLAFLQKELPKKEASAREAGREEGLTQGAAEARQLAQAETGQKIAQLQNNFSAVLKSLEKQKDQFFRNAEEMSLEIIRQMVQMILHREISTDPQTVISTLQAALKYTSERTSVTIKVNPRDYQTVAGQQSFWLPINSQLKNVQVVEDERVDAGGCLIDTGAGTVDARIGSQFQKLQEVLEHTFSKAASSEP